MLAFVLDSQGRMNQRRGALTLHLCATGEASGIALVLDHTGVDLRSRRHQTHLSIS